MNKLKLLASVTALVSASVVSQAANVDYVALQDLFGEPVTLSATGKPQRASEAPASMEIIDAETIRRANVQHIPELLRRYAGVDVRQAYKGFADVGIRGTNQAYSNRLLVLIDGRQVYQDHYGVTFWDALPVTLQEIRQIEVIKGPNASLFGFNAAAGVVNIITKSGLIDDVNEVQVRAGTQDYQQASAVMTLKPADNWAVRLSTNVIDSRGYSLEDNAAWSTDQDAPGLNTRSVMINSEYETSKGGIFKAGFDWTRYVADQVIPLYLLASGRGEATKLGSLNMSYAQETALGLSKVSSYLNVYDSAESDDRLVVVKAENLAKLSENQALRTSAEFRNNSVRGEFIGDDDRVAYNVVSASAMHDWSITDKLSWTNAVRFDHLKMWRRDNPNAISGSGVDYDKDDYSRSIDGTTFNTGLQYKATDLDTYRVSVARGLRIPAILQLGISEPFLGALPVEGNPNLDPEIFMNYELAYSRKLPQVDGEFKAVAYMQTVENVLSDSFQFYAGPTPYVTWKNTGNTSSVGLELDYKAKYMDSIEYGMSYAWQRFDDESDPNITTSAVYFGRNAARHHANLWGRYTQGAWEYDAALHYTSARDFIYTSITATPVQKKVDDHFMLNANIAYNINDKTAVALKGYNLIEEHVEVPSAKTAANGVAGGNEIGRSVFVSLTHKF